MTNNKCFIQVILTIMIGLLFYFIKLILNTNKILRLSRNFKGLLLINSSEHLFLEDVK
jgi:hypothetical protein